jgi:hypothetical protein
MIDVVFAYGVIGKSPRQVTGDHPANLRTTGA